MQNTEIKKLVAIKELKEWINNPLSKDDYTIYGLDKIKEKLLENKVPKSILNGFESLNRWYCNHFVYEALEKEQFELREVTAMSGYEILVLADELSLLHPSRPPRLLFDKSAFWLANCLVQKWFVRGQKLLEIINRGLFTAVLDGGIPVKEAFWFIIMLANKGYNIDIDIDYSALNLPSEMGCYKTALDNWDTTDMVLLDSIVSTLCENHLKLAHFGQYETTIDIQFGTAAWFVFAFEVLVLLSLREKNGLENPTSFSHPLMNLELNRLSNKVIETENSELFLQTIEKIRTQI